MVSRLQLKASQIGNILTSLEKKYDKNFLGNNEGTIREEDGETEKLKKSSSTSQIVGGRGDGGHKKRYSMRIDPIPPFNPNKQRKSDATPSPQMNDSNATKAAAAEETSKPKDEAAKEAEKVSENLETKSDGMAVETEQEEEQMITDTQ